MQSLEALGSLNLPGVSLSSLLILPKETKSFVLIKCPESLQLPLPSFLKHKGEVRRHGKIIELESEVSTSLSSKCLHYNHLHL